ncbi:MAG: L-histidine N(alpha)-methyltransferase [Burkholderiaceae bacterium]
MHDDRRELLEGLCAPSPFIGSKFFYDELGSRLFTAITGLDEYYPTRTEAAILRTHAAEIGAAVGAGRCTLIDLGAGDCEKAAGLFRTLRPAQYAAVDISADYLRQSLQRLRARFPELPMVGVEADFSAALALPAEVSRSARLFFYPGSSIGNFHPDQARGFLAGLRAQLDGDGGLLIGVDLVKDPRMLEAAYDDALGVTAAFNLNVLRNANRIAGTDFALADWRHVARYDVGRHRIEMYLEARREVRLRWPGGSRSFEAGTRIHTENSYKYRPEDFQRLLGEAGFDVQRCWTDADRWFAVMLARPVSGRP